MKMLNKINRLTGRKMRRLASRPAAAANQLMPEVRSNVGRANEVMNFAMPGQRTVCQTSPFVGAGNCEPIRIDYSNKFNGHDKGGRQLRPVDTSFSLPLNNLQLWTQ